MWEILLLYYQDMKQIHSECNIIMEVGLSAAALRSRNTLATLPYDQTTTPYITLYKELFYFAITIQWINNAVIMRI